MEEDFNGKIRIDDILEKYKVRAKAISIGLSVSRYIAHPLMYVIPIILLVLPLLGTVYIGLLVLIFLWFLVVLFSLILFVTMLLLKRYFWRVMIDLRETGRPLESIRGVDRIIDNLNTVNTRAIMLFFFVSVAFGFYLLGFFVSAFLYLVADVVLLLSWGLTAIFRVPPKVSLGSGETLIPFVTTEIHDVIIKGVFLEVIESYLDPITWLKFDDYRDELKKLLRDNIALTNKSNYINKEPIDLILEKMFLMLYLKKRMPKSIILDEDWDKDLLLTIIQNYHQDTYNEILREKGSVTDEELILEAKKKLGWRFIKDEIYEHFKDNTYEKIKNHPYLTFELMLMNGGLFDRIETLSPEFARLIDNIYIDLLDNLETFKQQDLYFLVSATTTMVGLKPINLFVFLFNNSNDYIEKPRKVTIEVVSERFIPQRNSFTVELPPKGEFNIKEEKLKILTEGEGDLIGYMSHILLNSVTLWLQLTPLYYGESSIIINIKDENGKTIRSKEVIVYVKRDIVGYFRSLIAIGAGVGGPVAATIRYTVMP